MNRREIPLPPLLRDSPDFVAAVQQSADTPRNRLIASALDYLKKAANQLHVGAAPSYLFASLSLLARQDARRFFSSTVLVDRLVRLLSVSSPTSSHLSSGLPDAPGNLSSSSPLPLLSLKILRLTLLPPSPPPQPPVFIPGHAFQILRLWIGGMLAGKQMISNSTLSSLGPFDLWSEFSPEFVTELLRCVCLPRPDQTTMVSELVRFVMSEEHVRNCGGPLKRLLAMLITFERAFGGYSIVERLLAPRFFENAVLVLNQSLAFEILRLLSTDAIVELQRLRGVSIESLVLMPVRHWEGQFTPILRMIGTNPPIFVPAAIRCILRVLMSDWRVGRSVIVDNSSSSSGNSTLSSSSGSSKKKMKRLDELKKITEVIRFCSPIEPILASVVQDVLFCDVLSTSSTNSTTTTTTTTEVNSGEVMMRRVLCLIDILSVMIRDLVLKGPWTERPKFGYRRFSALLLHPRPEYVPQSQIHAHSHSHSPPPSLTLTDAYHFHLLQLHSHLLLAWIDGASNRLKRGGGGGGGGGNSEMIIITESFIREQILSIEDEGLMFCYGRTMNHPRIMEMLTFALQTFNSGSSSSSFPRLVSASTEWIRDGQLLSENLLVCLFCFCQQQKLPKDGFLSLVQLLVERAGRLRARTGLSVSTIQFPQGRQQELINIFTGVPQFSVSHEEFHDRSLFWLAVKCLILFGCVAPDHAGALLWNLPILRHFFVLLIKGRLSVEELRRLRVHLRSNEEIRSLISSFCKEMFRMTQDRFFDPSNEGNWYSYFIACNFKNDWNIPLPDQEFVNEVLKLDSALGLGASLRRCPHPNFLGLVLQLDPNAEEWLLPLTRNDSHIAQNLPVELLIRFALSLSLSGEDANLFGLILQRLQQFKITQPVVVLQGLVMGLVHPNRRPENLTRLRSELISSQEDENAMLRAAAGMPWPILRKLFSVESDIEFLRKLMECCLRDNVRIVECCLLLHENMAKLLSSHSTVWMTLTEGIILRYFSTVTPSHLIPPDEKLIEGVILPPQNMRFIALERIFLFLLRFISTLDTAEEKSCLSEAFRSFVHSVISLNSLLIQNQFPFVFDWFLDSNNQQLAMVSMSKVDILSLVRNLCRFTMSTEMKISVLRHPLLQSIGDDQLEASLRQLNPVSLRLLRSFFVLNSLQNNRLFVILTKRILPNEEPTLKAVPRAPATPLNVSSPLLTSLRHFQQQPLPPVAPVPLPPPVGPPPRYYDDVLRNDPSSSSPQAQGLLRQSPHSAPLMLNSLFHGLSEPSLRSLVAEGGLSGRGGGGREDWWVIIDRCIAKYYLTYRADLIGSELLLPTTLRPLLLSIQRDSTPSVVCSEVLRRGFQVHRNRIRSILDETIFRQLAPKVIQLAVYQLPWRLSPLIDSASFAVERPRELLMRSKFDGVVRKAISVLLENPGPVPSPQNERWMFFLLLLKQHCLTYPYIMVQYLESIVRGLLRKVNSLELASGEEEEETEDQVSSSSSSRSVLLLKYEFVLDLLLSLRPAVFARTDLLVALLQQYYFDLLSKSYVRDGAIASIVIRLFDFLVSALRSTPSLKNRKKKKKTLTSTSSSPFRAMLTQHKSLVMRLQQSYREVLSHKTLRRIMKLCDWTNEILFLSPMDEGGEEEEPEEEGRRPPNHLLDSRGLNPYFEFAQNQSLETYLDRISDSLGRRRGGPAGDGVIPMPFLLDLLHVESNHQVRNRAYELILRVLSDNVTNRQMGQVVVDRVLQLLRHPSEEIRRHAVQVTFRIAPFCAKEQLFDLCLSTFRLGDGNATALGEAKKIVAVLVS